MKSLRSARWLLLALLISLIPASSYAGVFVSVGFAPPPLVVYDQPPCPEPGLMWTPGYWAYGPDGYYWVPGAWVPAPYVGALWTPGYWGWGGGLYVWHPGYWGPHVGYYGGVNYGFGYMGIGFVGGAWHGGVFAYNTAVMHVNTTVIHNTYVDRTIVERNTIVNDRHVAYAGGPGGINHPMTAQERAYSSERHMAATHFQEQHAMQARSNRAAYFNNNHGRPAMAAESRPLGAEHHTEPMARPNGMNGERPQARPAPQMRQENRPAPQMRQENRPAPEARPAPRQEERQEARPEQRSEPRGRDDNRR
jgi:hypothetical protein